MVLSTKMVGLKGSLKDGDPRNVRPLQCGDHIDWNCTDGKVTFSDERGKTLLLVYIVGANTAIANIRSEDHFNTLVKLVAIMTGLIPVRVHGRYRYQFVKTEPGTLRSDFALLPGARLGPAI